MLIALILAMAAQAGLTGEQNYTRCLEVYAVKYGAGNSESVDSILRIARGECSTFMTQIDKDDESYQNYKRLTGVSVGLDKERVIERAEGAATKALLAARARANP